MVPLLYGQVQEQRNGKVAAKLGSSTDQEVFKDPFECKGTRATLDVMVMCVRQAN